MTVIPTADVMMSSAYGLQEAIYYFNRGNYGPLRRYIDRHSKNRWTVDESIWWEGGQFEEAVMTRRSNRAVVMVMKNGNIEIAFYKDESRIVDAILMGNMQPP